MFFFCLPSESKVRRGTIGRSREIAQGARGTLRRSPFLLGCAAKLTAVRPRQIQLADQRTVTGPSGCTGILWNGLERCDGYLFRSATLAQNSNERHLVAL